MDAPVPDRNRKQKRPAPREPMQDGSDQARARRGLAAAAARVRACGKPQDNSTPTSSTVRSSSSLMILP